VARGGETLIVLRVASVCAFVCAVVLGPAGAVPAAEPTQGAARKDDAAKRDAAQAAAQAAALDAAQTAVEKWLVLVDKGHYGKAWDESASRFRIAVTKEQWTKDASTVRQPLGRIVSRSMKSREFKTSIPGAPIGQYAVIRFSTVYENKPMATETLTSMFDVDGTWRVEGYNVH
jgi:hypothetical protein